MDNSSKGPNNAVLQQGHTREAGASKSVPHNKFKIIQKNLFFCAIYSLVFNGSLNNIDKILGLIKCQLLTIRPLMKSFKIDDEIL